MLTRLLFALLAFNLPGRGELKVPAFTAYLEPLTGSARISEVSGVTRWENQKVLWFGNFKQAGKLECAVELKLPPEQISKLRLNVGGETREATATGDASGVAVARFAPVELKAPGYVRFELSSANPPNARSGDVTALIIDEPAAQNAHFNLKPRRNAASVHLGYRAPKGINVSAFYCEMTGIEEPVATYYMACGWDRGYFGMQVNSPNERRIIFSVWDSGNEAVDRAKVSDDDRVKLVAKGEGVYSGDFGNEGTGGHSHLKYPWKTGETQRFVVTAQPTDPTHTVYAGYWHHPEKKEWMLISSWRAPKAGGWLRGLYSFSENFGGSNGHLARKARYGNQWVRGEDGQWHELTSATFTHDGTGKVDRLDRFMGVEDGQFFLSHGGFLPGFTKSGESLTRPATGKPPKDFNPPPLPATSQGK